MTDEVHNTGLKEFRNAKIEENAWITVASEMASVGV